MSVEQSTAKAGRKQSASPSPQPTVSYQQQQDRISNTVYDITTEDEVVGNCTAQYYTTVDTESTENSPHTYNRVSVDPETPLSSSKGSTSSEGTELSTDNQRNLCVPAANSSQSDVNVKHWTHEEQFKQLYNLSPESERKEFLDKLFDFMEKKGTPITRIPIMAKQPLDLYRLFKLVVERGGLVEVIKKKAWRNVAKELNLPASITSAAFTMRSQYVKYLYPYECEIAKLSNPQELQMAIDSNKRDRRHSETMEFMSPQRAVNQGEIDITPVTNTQGLQLIGSPTVAIPHGSIPPYSGGFIVAPGAHMVAGSPQLVQMPHAGIPIVMPTPAVAVAKSDQTSQEGDDSSSDISEPPTKKLAVDFHQATVSLANSRLPFVNSHSSNFIVTPGGTHMVQAPHLASPSPQIVQMTPHPHIPGIMIPTTSSHAGLIREGRAEVESGEALTSAIRKASHTLAISSENGNGVPVATIPPHSTGNIVIATRGTPGLPTTSHMTVTASPGLVQMTPQPLVLPTSQGRSERGRGSGEEQTGESKKRDNMHVVSTKMPFANISIQSAGGKEGGGDGSNSASLLVTLELNNTVFQGVLFAKPISSSSPTR